MNYGPDRVLSFDLVRDEYALHSIALKQAHGTPIMMGNTPYSVSKFRRLVNSNTVELTLIQIGPGLDALRELRNGKAENPIM